MKPSLTRNRLPASWRVAPLRRWGESDGEKKISNNLQVSEKYVINFRFEVRNKGGHSSIPVADNAIYHLAGALQRLSTFGFPLKTNDVTAAYFQQMAKIETGSARQDLAKTAEGSQEATQRIAAGSPTWNAAAYQLRGHPTGRWAMP